MSNARERMLAHVVQALRNNRAVNLSDAEIDRATEPCCGGPTLARHAKNFRDDGTLRNWLPPLPLPPRQ